MTRSVVALAMMAGLVALPRLSSANSLYLDSVKAGETKYRTPEDLLDRVPFLSDIPRTFLLGDGFKMKLSTQELRIDHMGTRSHAPVERRDCLIGFSYTTPVAGFFTSRIDIPILHSAQLGVANWAPCTVGDYVAYFSRLPADHSSIKLLVSARF